MIKVKIWWLILAMGLSLVGLLVFQLSWLDDITSSNQQTFEIQVQDALQSVVVELEKKEAVDITIDNFHSDFIYKSLSSVDSSRLELIESTFEKKIVEVKDYQKDTTLNKDWASFYFSADTSDGLKNVAVSLEEDIKPNENNIVYVSGATDTLMQYKPAYEKRLKQISKKSEYVQLALHELFSGARKLADRLDAVLLDSLISNNLKERGINLKYEFAVYDELQNQTIISNTDNPKVIRSGLKVSLFPSDILNDEGYLYLNFPNQQYYLWSNVWVTLLLSMLFIGIVVFSFGYAIYTIVRQKKLSEIKNDFINNMTHELKTPISTVALACEALRDPDIQSTEVLKDRYLGIIQEENKRLGAQVEKVLQMAVIDRKDFELKKETISLHELIDFAISHVKLQLDAKQGNINLKLDAVRDEMYADKMHLSHIIINLLDNAIKYSDGSPEITIATCDKSNGIEFIVSDNGIGISKDGLDKIFEKFYRVPTGNVHDVKGFGLGLSYVRDMVEAHGGHISAKSEQKKGSVFTVFIPYDEQQIM